MFYPENKRVTVFRTLAFVEVCLGRKVILPPLPQPQRKKAYCSPVEKENVIKNGAVKRLLEPLRYRSSARERRSNFDRIQHLRSTRSYLVLV